MQILGQVFLHMFNEAIKGNDAAATDFSTYRLYRPILYWPTTQENQRQPQEKIPALRFIAGTACQHAILELIDRYNNRLWERATPVVIDCIITGANSISKQGSKHDCRGQP